MPTPVAPFPYAGDDALLPAVVAALRDVVDPEMSIGIVALGLVYDVAIDATTARVLLTMTSAACPVTELIVDEVTDRLADALPGRAVHVDVTWDPPWTPARMTDAARAALGWD